MNHKIIYLTFFFLTLLLPPNAHAKKSAQDHYEKGYSYFQSEKYEKAEKNFLKSLKLKKDPNTLMSLGMTYDSMNDPAKAISYYQQALQMDHHAKHYIYNNLGVSYAKIKQYEKAIQAFQNAIKTKPDYALSYYNLGKAYFANDQKWQAKAQFNKLKKMGNVDVAQALWEQIYKAFEK